MKKLGLAMVVILTIALVGTSQAANSGSGSRPYEDAWGNNYRNYDNMWKDSDKDGTINRYDYNDRNPRVQTPYQRDPYSAPSTNPYQKQYRNRW